MFIAGTRAASTAGPNPPFDPFLASVRFSVRVQLKPILKRGHVFCRVSSSTQFSGLLKRPRFLLRSKVIVKKCTVLSSLIVIFWIARNLGFILGWRDVQSQGAAADNG